MPSSSEPQKSTRSWDRFAIVLSGLCLVHCLAVPLALLLGSVASDWLVDTENEIHWLLFGLALPVSAWALWHGYRRHNSLFTILLGGIGLALMLAGVSHLFGDANEVWLTVVGVTALLIAHIRNAYFHLGRTRSPSE